MRTLEALAQEAIQVQDACNLSGIVHGFSRAITNLREVYPNAGTAVYNRHPICKLWASKIADLSGIGSGDFDEFGKAYQACQDIAKLTSQPEACA